MHTTASMQSRWLLLCHASYAGQLHHGMPWCPTMLNAYQQDMSMQHTYAEMRSEMLTLPAGLPAVVCVLELLLCFKVMLRRCLHASC
jgi:hypothetical protein